MNPRFSQTFFAPADLEVDVTPTVSVTPAKDASDVTVSWEDDVPENDDEPLYEPFEEEQVGAGATQASQENPGQQFIGTVQAMVQQNAQIMQTVNQTMQAMQNMMTMMARGQTQQTQQQVQVDPLDKYLGHVLNDPSVAPEAVENYKAIFGPMVRNMYADLRNEFETRVGSVQQSVEQRELQRTQEQIQRSVTDSVTNVNRAKFRGAPIVSEADVYMALNRNRNLSIAEAVDAATKEKMQGMAGKVAFSQPKQQSDNTMMPWMRLRGGGGAPAPRAKFNQPVTLSNVDKALDALVDMHVSGPGARRR